MLTPDEALARVLSLAAVGGPLPAVRVPLAQALGRALAADLRAPTSLPPFDAASMDGHAFAAADAPRPGARLPVAFEVAAGHPTSARLPRGTCCRIFTGAPIPRGADCVEMQERVAERGGVATFERAGERGRFIRPAGSDVKRGAVALPAGTPVDAGAIGLAAALGLSRLVVHRRPRVAILPTGDEVVPLGTRPGPGQIVESNAHALAAAVADAGGEAVIFPVVPDRPALLRRAVARARRFDVLLTTGGVSVGTHDLVRAALEDSGARLDFWRVALRPGKPLAVGRLGRTLVFGLPGNPASALVTFELFARPALRALAALGGSGRVVVPGRLAEAQEKPAELALLLRVRAVRRAGDILLMALPTQVSGHVTSVAGAGGLAILPAGKRRFAAGARVEVVLLRPPDAE